MLARFTITPIEELELLLWRGAAVEFRITAELKGSLQIKHHTQHEDGNSDCPRKGVTEEE